MDRSQELLRFPLPNFMMNWYGEGHPLFHVRTPLLPFGKAHVAYILKGGQVVTVNCRLLKLVRRLSFKLTSQIADCIYDT